MHVAASSPSVWAQPGTLGFLVVFGMGVVLFFVFRSMSKHLRKVREAAEAEQPEHAENAEPDGLRGPGVDQLLTSDHDRQSDASAASLDFDR
jgi:Na+-transporting methylmalonyl-CoA/oxaloacetate decarboxylase gamma subunit